MFKLGKTTKFFRAFLLASVVACSSDSVTSPVTSKAAGQLSNEISDGAHAGTTTLANPHFFYLPPAVPQPNYSGAFDAKQSPEVMICQYDPTTGCATPVVADFTMSTGPGSETVRLSDQLYIVNWHTDQFALDLTKTYRIRTLVAGTELGHADVIIDASKVSLKNVDTQQDIALLDGKTLPIKFRIEEGAIAAVGPNGGTLTLPGGALAVTVPPGALTGTFGVTALPTSIYPDDPEIASSVYEIGPAGTTFSTPATLTIAYDPAKLPADVAPDHVGLYTVVTDVGGKERWEANSLATVDATHHTVSAPVTHFSRWAVLAQANSVAVTPATGTVYVPETAYGVAHNTLQLTATVYGSGGKPLANRTVTWVSSDATLATVDSHGLVTGVAGGSATVTATSSGLNASSAVTVLRPVATIITTDPSMRNLSLVASDYNPPSSRVLTLLLYDKSGRHPDGTGALTGRIVTYLSQNPAVATVDANGLVTGLTPGTAVIVVSSEGVSTSGSLTVEGPVVSLTLQGVDGSSGPLRAYSVPRGELGVTAILRDAAGNLLSDRQVSYTVSNPAIALVGILGWIPYVDSPVGPELTYITAIGDGSTALTANIEGLTATIPIEMVQVSNALSLLTSQRSPDCHDAGPFGNTYANCRGNVAYYPERLLIRIIGTTPNGFGSSLFTFSIEGSGGCCGSGQTLTYQDPGNNNTSSPGNPSNDWWASWNTTFAVVTPGAGGVGDVLWLPNMHIWYTCGIFGADHCYTELGQASSPWLAFYDWNGTQHIATIVNFNGTYYFRIR